jgi:hypothetical protein
MWKYILNNTLPQSTGLTKKKLTTKRREFKRLSTFLQEIKPNKYRCALTYKRLNILVITNMKKIFNKYTLPRISPLDPKHVNCICKRNFGIPYTKMVRLLPVYCCYSMILSCVVYILCVVVMLCWRKQCFLDHFDAIKW